MRTAKEMMEWAQKVEEMAIRPEFSVDPASVRLLSECCTVASETIRRRGEMSSNLLAGIAETVAMAIVDYPRNNSPNMEAWRVAVEAYLLAICILDAWATNLIGSSTGGATRGRIDALHNLCGDLTEKELANLRIEECPEERADRMYGDAAYRRGSAVKIGSGGRRKGSQYAYQLWATWG